ncbi:MAG: thiol peroxidase [Nitrospinae bacterium]|nr:thiol peroxidase [Nitrospinota bacterium]
MKRLLTFSFMGLLLMWADTSYAGGNTQVSLHGKPLTLTGTPLQEGQPLPALTLPDSGLTMTDLQSFKGQVTIISIVPSIDTKVCEKQTHILSEENGGLDSTVRLVTISRDLPFAQKRFAVEAKIKNILFLSDYRDGGFGTATGLMIQENRLLARAMVVLDKEGVIRHLEIVPDLGQLPDMKKAFQRAGTL